MEAESLRILTDSYDVARELGMGDVVHLWIDAALARKSAIPRDEDPLSYANWIQHWWVRQAPWV